MNISSSKSNESHQPSGPTYHGVHSKHSSDQIIKETYSDEDEYFAQHTHILAMKKPSMLYARVTQKMDQPKRRRRPAAESSSDGGLETDEDI
jgi:UDP-3-O-[3-hydroxymyristoyl] glucosamine N-acyltransferase